MYFQTGHCRHGIYIKAMTSANSGSIPCRFTNRTILIPNHGGNISDEMS